ncbi:hypothetical protein [Lysinibacillus sphaericus]|uniref:hypothetical protein n=1 Tax=Lysinibacillus sphaericus TaxID=1421 RepID=UPI003D721EDC
MFNAQTTFLNDKFEFHYIQIGDITDEFKVFLNNNLTSICKGEYHINELKYIKIQLKDFLRGKEKDENKKLGSISELYAHLFFKSLEFSNKFVFLNLEENSLKKGFDGFFEKAGEHWILDSKSGHYQTKNISHRSKILEANRSAKEQILGETENNPWENAFNHANSGDVRADESLLKVIRRFSNQYMDKNFIRPNELNVILASTIFLFDSWKEQTIDYLITQLNNIDKNFDFAKTIIFCSNQKNYEDFINYLEEEDYGQRREVTAN